MRELIISILLSALFTLGQFVCSLLKITSRPGWKDFLWGAAGIFVVLIVYRIVASMRLAYLYKKHPDFWNANKKTGITWKEYKKVRKWD